MPTGTTAAQYTLTSQPLVTDLTPGDNGSLEALTPNMLAEGVPLDWSEWDYLLQDFALVYWKSGDKRDPISTSFP